MIPKKTNLNSFTLKLFLIMLILSAQAIAQVGAPSTKPSQLNESAFFTDHSNSIPASRKKTLTNNAGDDSNTLQNLINSLSSQGGGVITIPAGTWELGEITLKSNIHLRFNPNAIVKPKLSNLTDKSIFIMGYNGANISNVSISSTSGKFTIDMSGIPLNQRVLVFNIKELENFKIAGCSVIDKWTVHSTVNCGLSKRNGVWAGAKKGLIKDITVKNAHGGYGAVQVRVGTKLFFKNIISTGGGATLRIETDGHETSGKQAPVSMARVSEISGYNIKCTNGNSAVMIQPWGARNGWFDIEKVEAISCMATVRIDRAYVAINAANIGNFDPDSRITNVISKYGTNAQVQDGQVKSVPCSRRNLIGSTFLPGMPKWFKGPSIAPVMYNASSTTGSDPRYYSVNIPNESLLSSNATNFPAGNLIISRWNNTVVNCGNTGGGTPPPPSSSGQFYIINHTTGQKLKPKNNTNGADIIQVAATDNSNWTKWTKVDTGGGFFRFKNVQTGKYFAPVGTADGNKLAQQPTTSNGSWTQWKEVSANNGYVHIQNRGMEKHIRPVGNNNGSLIEIRPTSWTGTWTQWKVTSTNSSARVGDKESSSEELNDANNYRLTVAPNPANGFANITVDHSIVNGNIELFDLLGHLLYATPYQESGVTIDTHSFDKGIYIIKARTDNGWLSERLIIK